MHKYIILMALMVSLLAGCKATDDEYAHYRHIEAAAIYQQGVYHISQGDYEAAAKDFEALEILYPFNPFAEQAHLNVIYAYYKAGDRASTMASADRYIRLYRGSHHLDYAYYMRAMANFHHERPVLHKLFRLDRSQRDLTLARDSFRDFKIVTKRFGNSIYATDAQYHLILLHDILSRSEFFIANYYFRRGAFVAAANRASKLVNEFPQSPLTARALVIMVESYHHLHLPHKADEAMKVLALNYPHSNEYQELLKIHAEAPATHA